MNPQPARDDHGRYYTCTMCLSPHDIFADALVCCHRLVSPDVGTPRKVQPSANTMPHSDVLYGRDGRTY